MTGSGRVIEIVVALLMIIGIIILLFAPLVSGSDYTGNQSYNLQQLHSGISELKDAALSYAEMLGSYGGSDVQQGVAEINALLFVILLFILLLYASLVITVINFFKKVPRLYAFARWTAFSIGVILLIVLILAKSQMSTESSGIMSGVMSTFIKLGFGGVIFGLIFIGAAIFLHAKPDILSGVSINDISEKTGLQWRCSNPSCGHMNNIGSLFCSVCGTRKDSDPAVPPPSTWRCSNPACNHTNSDGSLFCAKCGTRKSSASVTPPSRNWICANGHSNTGDSLFCSVCGIAIHAVPTSKPQWRCSCGRENDMSRTACAYCGRSKNGGDSGLFQKDPEF